MSFPTILLSNKPHSELEIAAGHLTIFGQISGFDQAKFDMLGLICCTFPIKKPLIDDNNNAPTFTDEAIDVQLVRGKNFGGGNFWRIITDEAIDEENLANLLIVFSYFTVYL